MNPIEIAREYHEATARVEYHGHALQPLSHHQRARGSTAENLPLKDERTLDDGTSLALQRQGAL